MSKIHVDVVKYLYGLPHTKNGTITLTTNKSILITRP